MAGVEVEKEDLAKIEVFDINWTPLHTLAKLLHLKANQFLDDLFP